MPDGRHTYDKFDRKRIWLALVRICQKNPGLTLSDIATQISVYRGVNFDRKYFQRLATVSDAHVNNVVEWIIYRFDGSFRQNLLKPFDAESISIGDTTSFEFYKASFPAWRVLARKSIKSIIDRIDAEELQLPLSENEVSIHYSPISFVESGFLLRLQSFGVSKASVIYFAYVNGSAIHLDGSISSFEELLNISVFDINRTNIVELCQFFIIHCSGSKGVIPISSISDMYAIPNLDLSRDSKALASIVTSYCPPVVKHDSITNSYIVELMTVSMGLLFANYLVVEASGEITIQTRRVVTEYDIPLDFNEENFSLPLDTAIKINHHPKAKEIREYLNSQLALSDLGRTYSKLCHVYDVNIIILPSNDFQCGFDRRRINIYIFVPYSDDFLERREVLEVVMALRIAEHEFIGFESKDPMKNFNEYAAREHAKNLDSIVYMCKFVSDIEDDGQKNEYISVVESMGHKEIYEARIAGASKDRIFDLYEGK